jgi:fluoride exporter
VTCGTGWHHVVADDSDTPGADFARDHVAESAVVANVRRVVVLAVALGGAVGACLRVAVGDLTPHGGPGFPWHTFLVNVGGSGLLAALPALAAVRRHRLLPPLLGTGVLGGFTTLSVWSQETHDLLAGGRTALGVTYALGTLLACLTVVALVDRASTPEQRTEFDLEEGDL